VNQPMIIGGLSGIDYPESDGEPMAETDAHRDEMAAFIETLKWHFRADVNVYVSGNNFFYYEEGNPKACASFDTYVVKGVEARQRRVFKLWEERKVPDFVMEMSSRSTWLEDIGNKKALCAGLGVREYFLYDPEADVVRPPLQGFRLRGGAYHRIRALPGGAVPSDALGLALWLDNDVKLHARDMGSGENLLRAPEARAAAFSLEARVRELEQRLAEAGLGSATRAPPGRKKPR